MTQSRGKGKKKIHATMKNHHLLLKQYSDFFYDLAVRSFAPSQADPFHVLSSEVLVCDRTSTISYSIIFFKVILKL